MNQLGGAGGRGAGEGEKYAQQCDPISLLLFFQNKDPKRYVLIILGVQKSKTISFRLL
jgi:hypothetical protein